MLKFLFGISFLISNPIFAFQNVSQSISDLPKPNIVFLLVDDLGWGDFGCYGAQFNETPNIDLLASQGMLFTNAYAAATVCSPSRAAILTGRYPARTHLTDWIKGHDRPYAKLRVPDWEMQMDHQRTILPEAFKNAGYKTAFIGKWHLMPEGQPQFDKHYPTDHGFDLNIGGREWGKPNGPNGYFSPFDMPNVPDGKNGDFLTDKLTEQALTFLDTVDHRKPFLLYFSYYTVHGPIMAPEDLVNKYEQKAESFSNQKDEYINPSRAAMVERLDVSIGRLMQKLDDLGITDNTIIVLTGDNGGNFDKTTAGLRGFKGLSYEGGVREPLIIKWPGEVRAGSQSDVMVIGTDFYPSLLAMAGLPLLPEEHKDGVNLLPIFKEEKTTIERDELFWHYPHYHRTNPYGAIRKGDWKLIEFFEDGKKELYNLKEDPYELIDVSIQYPEKALKLYNRLVSWRKNVGAQMPVLNPNYDPKKEKRSK